MINNDDKYIFTITNTFSFIYFLWLIREYKLKKIIFIINNSYDFFTNWRYDIILKNLNINYILINWENRIRKFPYSIIDILKIKKEIFKKCVWLKWYYIITWHDYISTD